jgi:hypothetical protein
MVPFDENAALKFIEAADSKIDPPVKLQERLPIVGKGDLQNRGSAFPRNAEAIERYLLTMNRRCNSLTKQRVSRRAGIQWTFARASTRPSHTWAQLKE